MADPFSEFGPQQTVAASAAGGDPFTEFGAQPVQNQSLSQFYGGNVVSDLGHAAVQGGGDFLANLLQDASNAASKISPSAVGIKGIQMQAPLANAAQSLRNYVQNNYPIASQNIATSAVKGAMQFAPFLAAPELGAGEAEALLASKGASASSPFSAAIYNALSKASVPAMQGAQYGATQSPNAPLSGAIAGATTGALGAQVPGLIGGALKGAINQAAKYVKPAIEGEIGQSLENVRKATPQNAYNEMLNSYNLLKGHEDNAWENVKNMAANFDENRQTPIDNSSYVQAGKDLIAKLNNSAKGQSTLSAQVKPAVDMVQNFIAQPKYDANGLTISGHDTQSLQGLIAHRQALNSSYGDYLNNNGYVDNPAVANAISTMKTNLKSLISNNLPTDNPGDLANFSNEWERANALTKQRHDVFESMPGNTGKNTSTYFSNFANNPKASDADTTAAINQLMPTAGQVGDEKFDKVAQMLGRYNPATNSYVPNPYAAIPYIKNRLFKNSFQEEGIDTQAALNRYKKLSDDQRSALTTPREQLLFNALSKLKNTSGAKNLITSGIAAALGSSLGAHFGEGSLGAAAGVGAQQAFAPIMEKIMENPAIKESYINRLNNIKGSPVASKTKFSLAKNIAANLPYRSLTIPSVVNSQENS